MPMTGSPPGGGGGQHDHSGDHLRPAAVTVNDLTVGDITFANGWVLTEVDNGIALLNAAGEEIQRWTS